MLQGLQVLASPSSKRLSITEQVHLFRATKSLGVLPQLAMSIVSQRRALELLFGAYCHVVQRPSPVYAAEDPEVLRRILEWEPEFAQRAVLSRGQLMRAFGDRFAIHDLPPGFVSVRRASIWLEDGTLIVGEYGEGARLACITERACVVSNHYQEMPGVRHIHSIQKYGAWGEFLVATGDGHKLLDLWVTSCEKLRFVRRLRCRLAGYTAAAEVGGEYYFGSDFSGRPNFIQVLGGPRYFFPAKAYRMHAIGFHVLFDRYIAAVSGELRVSGRRRAVSVFDTRTRRFLYCDYAGTSFLPRTAPGEPDWFPSAPDA